MLVRRFTALLVLVQVALSNSSHAEPRLVVVNSLDQSRYDYLPKFRDMQEARHLALDSPVFQKGALSVVLQGIAGTFAAATLSDWMFKCRRPPVVFLGYFLQVLYLAVIRISPGVEWVIGAFVVNSFAISMVHSVLSGTASMDFGRMKAAASATGMFDGMQYIGEAAVGLGMGWMLEHLGMGHLGTEHDRVLFDWRDLDDETLECRAHKGRWRPLKGC